MFDLARKVALRVAQIEKKAPLRTPKMAGDIEVFGPVGGRSTERRAKSHYVDGVSDYCPIVRRRKME